MMTTTTQRLLDLAAAVPASHDADLLLLREASELYQQGLQELRQNIEARFGALPTADLVAATAAAGMPGDESSERTELLLLLALAEWELTPAAMAYAQITEDAARRGVCLIPEE
ncbi:hypothetical protein AB0G55_21955 [Streptomyces toyocaensis]|uniref:hypothetical protein n=1 Tax=Streptomyces toyocaensis TaxID=55952 RepID=UPI0033F42D7B